MIIISITEFKRNIREFQDEKLPKTEDLERNMKTSLDFICGPRALFEPSEQKSQLWRIKRHSAATSFPGLFPH